MEAIRIEGLTRRFKDVTAVDGLCLQIRQGELLALLGINGAGKTTTVKMLSGLLRPTSGDAFLMGNSILTQPEQVKKVIALSPQENAVAPGLSAEENLKLMCGAYGFSAEVTAQRLQDITAILKLEHLLKRRAGKLSGGQQRRLSIAMALISQPKILFLDEPTLGLDVLARSDLWDLIKDLKGKVTVILTTHYMEEAEALADRVAIMAGGRLLLCDTPENIKKQTGADRFEDAFIRIVKEAQP